MSSIDEIISDLEGRIPSLQFDIARLRVGYVNGYIDTIDIVDGSDMYPPIVRLWASAGHINNELTMPNPNVAEYVVGAMNAVPQLLGEIRKLRRENSALMARLRGS